MEQPRPLQLVSGQICQICGDDVGITVDGELFVACNECAFPICRGCYEYERREGNQSCPQCKTRFKRLKGKRQSAVNQWSRVHFGKSLSQPHNKKEPRDLVNPHKNLN